MKQVFRQLVIFVLVIFSIGVIAGITNIYAKNDKIILSEKYTGKKLDRIKGSIKGKKDYRFLISSNDSLDSIKDFFVAGDKNARVKQYGEDKYMIRLPLNSQFLSPELSLIDAGILPIKIGNYDVIQPEIVEGLGFLDGEETTLLWGNIKIGANLFQEELSTKEKIKVGILDTGIDYTHTDLDNNYNSIFSHDFVNEDTDALDDNGHGTQVAGIIGAEVNGAGRYGVNSNTDLVGLKVLDASGIGTTYDILEAIEYAKISGIKVLNMSFGGIGDASTSVICQAITDAKINGIFTIVSAGNNNSAITNIVPASCSDSITVGSTDNLNEKATFSNYGTGVTIYAPGVDIYSTNSNNTYKNISGTSFSAGFVSGLVAKELAFSGGISYDEIVSNIKNNYNLLSSFYAPIIENDIIPIEVGTGIFVAPENMNLYYRFNDFKYLSIDDNYVYYSDIQKQDNIYRLQLNNEWLTLPENYYRSNPQNIFRNKNNFHPAFFNSGEYIKLSDYKPTSNIQTISEYNTFVANEYLTSSLGKYDICLKFEKISGKKILDIPGNISYIDDTSLYYQNSNDNYSLYRIKNDGSDINLIGTKIIDPQNSRIAYSDDVYLYYQNYDDNYSLYRIKKDGTDTSFIGTKIIDSQNARIRYSDDEYFYYHNSNDNYKLYGIKKDGSDINLIGKKIIDSQNSRITYSDNEYIYYQNSNDNYKLYRIKKDGSDTSFIGTKIIDSQNSRIAYSDDIYFYYQNYNDNYSLYRIKKDGSDTSFIGKKIIDSQYTGITHSDDEYFYYHNSNDNYKLYRIKKDGSDTSLIGTKIIDVQYSRIVYSDDIYFYYQNSNDYNKLYRIKKDGTDTSFIGTKIIDSQNARIISSDDIYLYYQNYDSSYNYNLYRIKKDGTDNLKISDVFNWYISNDLDYIYYMNYKDNTHSFYKVKKDGTDKNLYIDENIVYSSPEILLDSILDEIRINIDSIVPTGTDYNFYLANQKTEETLFEANEYGIDIRGNQIYLYGDNYLNGIRQDILSKVNIGDKIYLDKNGNIGEFTVEYKDDRSIRVVYTQDLWEFTGARIYIFDGNYTKINSSELDGNTNINLNSLFGFKTNKLYYRIELVGDQSDATKTPIINSVEFTKIGSTIVASLTSDVSSINLDNQELVKFTMGGINDLDEGETLTFAYSLDGTNYTYLLTTGATPINNGEFSFFINFTNLPDGDITIYAKVNDGLYDSNIVKTTLNKNSTPSPITINGDLTIATGEEYLLLNGSDITVTGNIINSGSIVTSSGGISKITAKGNIENNGVLDVTSLYLNGTQPRTINGNTPITTNMYLQSDITITGDFIYDGVIYLNGYTLYIDGTKTIIISGVSGYGAITSSNGEGSGETIIIKTISQDTAPLIFEIENVQVTESITTDTTSTDTIANIIVAKIINLVPSTYYTTSTSGGYLDTTATQTVSGNIQTTTLVVSSNYVIDTTTTTIVSKEIIVDSIIENVDISIIEALVLDINKVATESVILRIDYKQGYTYLFWDKITDAVGYNFYFADKGVVQVTDPYFEIENASLPTGEYTWYVRGVYGDGSVSEPTVLFYVSIVNENYSPPVFLPGEKLIDYFAKINGGTVINYISDDNTAGDPVNLNTGEFTYSNVLMQHNSKGFPFQFELNYKNKTFYEGTVGTNFDHSYNINLSEQSDENIYYYDGKLGVFEFVKNDIGFDYNSTINAELTIVDGKYELVFNNSKKYKFNTDLKLETIIDNYNNTFSFVYNTDSNLSTIIDSNNREYNLSYNTDLRLQNITDFNGNKVEFVYYGVGETDGSEFDLKNIKIVNGISEKDINFTYTIGTDDILSHNIIKLIDSENNIYVENTYDENDRVSSQMYGTGTINYTYTVDIDNKITQNSVVDREGNNVVYSYDSNGNTIKKIVKKLSGDSIYNYEYNDDNYISKEILPLGNGYTFKYDSNYNLVEIRQKTDINAVDSIDDIVYSYEYDSVFNKITKITNPNGSVVNFELDINGNITRKEVLGVADIDGISQTIVETYDYNTIGELIKRIDANGNEVSFEYSSGSLVKSVKNPLAPLSGGIATEYGYDNKGNIVSITDGEGNITNISYDEFNLLNSITTPEGIVSEYNYNKLNKKVNESIILGDLSKVNTSYEYNILDNPTKITSDVDSLREKIIVTKYDKNNNITEITDGNNATVQFTYNEQSYITEKKVISGTDNIITKYIYDNNNRLVKQINPNLSETIFTYDLFDRITKQTISNGVYITLSYDKQGNVLETNTFSPTNELLQKESNSYDKLGRNIKNTKYLLEDNSELVNKIYYDSVGNIVKIIDAKLGEVNYSYDSFNRLSQITDALGNTITNTYDKNNKLVSKTITGTDGKVVTTSYEYDFDSRLIKETNSLGEFVSYSYNNLNQVVSKTDKDGTLTNYEYDYVGNVLQESIGTKTTKYEYDINSNLTKIIDANSNITTYEYDNLNRVVKQTYPNGNTIIQEYDISGNLVKRTDPNGTIVINSYDELNRLTGRTIQTGTGVLGVTSETYTYDELGRVINGTDNLGNDLSFNYDSLNRLITETNSNKQIDYSYDNSGNITAINNINYDYDIVNRLTSVKNGTTSVSNYTYDSLTQLSEILGNGITTTYSYDELLRLSSLGEYNYDYNIQGNITSDGKDNYKYDIYGRLTSVNYDEVNIPEYNGDKIERFFYDNLGNRTSQENYTLKDIQSETCTDETVVEDITLPNGKTKTVERKQRVCETSVTQVEKQKNTLTYDANSLNQYTKLQNLNKNDEVKKEFTYKYDNNGNLTKDDINQYFYDYKNRLVRVIQNEVIKVDENLVIIEVIPEEEIVRYTYDILGRRTSKITEEKTTNFIYAGQNAIEEIITNNIDNSLLETRQNIYSNNLDDILSVIITDHTKETPETNQYYYEKNHLGSITRITDEQGSVIEQYEYDTFGVAYASVNNVEAVTTAQNKKTLSIKNAKGSETSNGGDSDELTIDNIRYKRYNGKGKIGNTRLYTGREYDAELKLYYNRARYYSPDLGRFINRDPIDINDDINLYAYVGNNSVMYTDRNGEFKQFIAGVIYGDYNEDGNWYSVGGQIVAGLVPYYGQVSDVKDFSYQWDNGNKTDIAFALIAFVPLAGDGLKALNKSGVIEKGIKNGREIVGGAYSKVRKLNIGGEVHHIPSKSVSPVGISKGPGILMDKVDHGKTASWGRKGKVYQQKELELIKNGKYNEAFEMGIKDIQSKFGNKYNDGIKQMRDYFYNNLMK